MPQRVASGTIRRLGGLLLRRARSIDVISLALLFAIWGMCFAVALRSLSRVALFPSVGVRAAAERGGYPIVVDLPPWGDAETAVRRGDRLVRLGDADLRGVGPLGFYAQFAARARLGEALPRVIYERAGRRDETRVPTPSSWRPPLLPSLGFAASALFVALRAAPTPLTHSLSCAALVVAIAVISPITGGFAVNYAGLAVGAVAWSLVFPLILSVLLSLERGASSGQPTPRWPWLFASLGPLAVSGISGFPLTRSIGIPLWIVGFVACAVVILMLVARAYRAMDRVGRRQARWVALGFYTGLGPIAMISALVLIDGALFRNWLRFQPWLVPSFSFALLVPISLLFAAYRYNLFDVDRLLSATASYNVVLVVLLGGALVLVPRLAAAASSLLAIDPRTGQVALSLALAALAVPAHRQLRPQIDRLFFKERYDLDRGISALLTALGGCADAREVTRFVGESVVRLLRPEACAVYAIVGESYEPTFVEGRAVPPAFEASSLLVHTLRERRGPLALSDAGRRPDASALDPFDRAALQTLEAEVIVPVHRDGLVAFLCLGPKRSGDVYTATDLGLLAAVAQAVSHELYRFDQAELIRQVREMQESLRHYVPGAVAEQLAKGAAPGSEVREVTVLFVDLRGYTGFAESRAAEEIFSTLNRYTHAVSEAVCRHGGSVVEFHGDGLLAVFGAPSALAHKERAAVEAARAIVAGVTALPAADGVPFSLGIGIATGEGFAGNIQAVDRRIWCVIGNTTNLAARLQSLTRELDAVIAIDAATQAGAGYVCADFVRVSDVRIRGRSEPREVWVLPLRRE